MLNKRQKAMAKGEFQLIRKLFSALCSAACKHLAAISGGHSFTETVLLGTLSFLRLVGSLSDHC